MFVYIHFSITHFILFFSSYSFARSEGVCVIVSTTPKAAVAAAAAKNVSSNIIKKTFFSGLA